MRVYPVLSAVLVLMLAYGNGTAHAQTSWTKVPLADGPPVTAILSASDGYIYAGTAVGTVFRFNGQVREDLGRISSGTNVTDIVEAGDGVLLAVAEGVHRSTDHGMSWAQVPGIGAAGIVANLRGDVVAAVGSRAFRSSDRGGTWAEVSAGLPSSASPSVAANRGGTVVMGTSAGLYLLDGAQGVWSTRDMKSTALGRTLIADDGAVFAVAGNSLSMSEDSGRSWKRLIDIDPGGETITALSFDSLHGIVVGISGFVDPERSRVLRSTDRGESWLPLHTGLSSRMLFAIAAGPLGRLYASAGDGSVYTMELETASAGEIEADPSDLVTISPSVVSHGEEIRVRLSLSREQKLHATLIDAGGSLRSAVSFPGSGSPDDFTISTDRLSSGTYWLILELGDRKIARRIVVLR